MKAHELLTTASPHDAREKPCTFLHARSPSSLHLPSLDHRSINSTQSSSLRSHTPFIPAVAAGYFKQRKRLTVTFSIALRIIYNLRQIFATRPQMTERHLRVSACGQGLAPPNHCHRLWGLTSGASNIGCSQGTHRPL